jgi:7-cyano-7-deazaguanine reductase
LEKDIIALDKCDGAIFLLDGEHTGTILELGYAYYIAKNKSEGYPLIGVYTSIRGKESLDSMVKFCLEEKGVVVTSLSELEKYLEDLKKNIDPEGIIKVNDGSKNFRSILKTVENEFKGREYQVELSTDELSAICPFTDLPDYYKLRIFYVPDKHLVELKSLKLYLVRFKDSKFTHEALCNRIFEDLVDLLKPKYMRIELEANIRGGIKTVVKKEYKEKEETCQAKEMGLSIDKTSYLG